MYQKYITHGEHTIYPIPIFAQTSCALDTCLHVLPFSINHYDTTSKNQLDQTSILIHPTSNHPYPSPSQLKPQSQSHSPYHDAKKHPRSYPER